MKLHLPRLLAAAVLASLVSAPAYTAEIPDEYKDNTVLVWDADCLADYASNASTDYVAFLLDMDIEVPSDISLSGGNLYFTSRNAQLPVSLAFTGNDSAALTDLSSLVFDTLSGLSFTSYKKGAISTSGNLIIQNVNDGVEDSENPDVFFSGNSASSTSDSYGGAIYASGDVSISGNGDVTFTENSASSSSYYSYGGAIYARYEYGDVSISGNGDVSFTGNTVSSSSHSYGGAIYAYRGVSISGNGDVSFTGNTASFSRYSCGGAIFAEFGNVSISGNGDVSFMGNTASSSSISHGGAIYAEIGNVSITGNGDVLFTGNSASSSFNASYGGAIFADDVSISGNGDVLFTGNSISAYYFSYGGAIHAGSVSITGNGDVYFTENSASCDDLSIGGAIHAYSGVSITGNGDVLFTENSVAGGYGGAISADDGVSINGNGDVTFLGNSASSYYNAPLGGAIVAFEGGVSINGNGDVTFSGNSASSSSSSFSSGGSIYAECNLSIQNNDSVLFEKNAEISDGTYRLRSIYAADWSDDIISLSAAAGRSIEFRDSVYIDSYLTVNLNADYGDTRQQGDIIFTGKYAEQHLNELLEAADAGRTATAQEILNSRTTEVNALTYLYGGRLRVEDGAIYQGQGITVHKGSDATVLVKDATLSHEGYALTFNAGTTLQVEGESLIVGDVLMMAQSVLNLEGETTINGALTLGLGMQLAGNILAEVQNLQVGESLTLVSGLESLAVQTQNLMRSVEYTTVMDGYEVQASEYFSNLAGNTGLVMRYDSEAGTVSICNTPAVPEPTTATLSLLAFAALAARRRRK